MSVIQISKIQQRRGQTAQTGFPQLSSGEFGWSIDTQELYIGNGSVDEGAPAVGDTQLITEHNVTNFFLYGKSSYAYGATYDSYGNIVTQIGIPRTIQKKLDDAISLSDFGDITTVTDHTSIIQRAIDYVSVIGKPITFPESSNFVKSSYIITGTIFIPPLTEIRGAGTEKTVIKNIGTLTSFQTVGLDKTTFDQGTGISTAINRPKNIRINGITLVNTSTTVSPLIQLDCATDSIIEECGFIGGDDNITTATSSLSQAINFRDVANYPANTLDNIRIKNNKFYKLSNAISSDYDMANILITENKFYNLDMGIVFGKNLTGADSQKYGPQHVQISNNFFEYINNQAIYEGSTSTNYPTDINSVNNWFYNVGCNQQGDSTSTQVTEVITFNSFGNSSIGDSFDRLTKLNSSNEYITNASSVKSVIKGPVLFKTKTSLVYEIPGTGTGFPWFSFPRSTFQYGSNVYNQIITIEYTINKPAIGLIRRGEVEITVSGTTALVKDNFSTNNQAEGSAIGITATVDTTKNLVTVYISNSSAYLGNILYSYNVRQ